MTDYRLGFRADSRHWLSIAKATDQAHPGGLVLAWRERLAESLADLNHDVYGAAERSSDSSAVEYGKATPSDDAADAGTGTGTGSALPLAPPSQRGHCRSNADCKTGEICDGKSCTPL
jgi:hypothetical protein